MEYKERGFYLRFLARDCISPLGEVELDVIFSIPKSNWT